MRLFLALDLPASVRAALARWAEAELPDDLRPPREENLHVTLAFLGWREGREADVIWDAASRAVAELALPRLEPGAVLPVPRRRPRLVALDLTDATGTAAGWHRAVSDALARDGLYRPEKRPFWPHVTLARARRGARVRAPRSSPELAPFVADALTLYRSDLSRDGARYTALERVGERGARPS